MIKKIHKVLMFIVLMSFFMSSIPVNAAIIQVGDFPLNSQNFNTYIQLSWDPPDSGHVYDYRIWQKEDGKSTFETRSANYDRTIRVLNIYPSTLQQGTFKSWMSSSQQWMIGQGDKTVLSVDEVLIDTFNQNPDAYLKDGSGNFKYDVLFFGASDINSGKDININSRNSVERFIQSGRGVLFGHDTYMPSRIYEDPNWPGYYDHPNFVYLMNVYAKITDSPRRDEVGSKKVKVVDSGFLTSYPFKISGAELNIPFSHLSSEQSNGTIWMKYVAPYENRFGGPYTDNAQGTNNFYLASYNNTAFIQTGHTPSATDDEIKALTNAICYLAQLTPERQIKDYSVRDLKAPTIPNATQTPSGQNVNVKMESQDVGTYYEYYVESLARDGSASKKSDTIDHEFISGLKGYIAVVDNSPSTVPSVTSPVNVGVDGLYTVNNVTDNMYIHMRAVDNWGNIGDTAHLKLNAVPQTFKITEKHQKPDGTTLPSVPDTETIVPKDGVYNKVAPKITDWVAVAYKIGNGPETQGTRIIINPVTKDETVSFIYKEDKNNNGIPDDEEDQDFTVTEKYQDPNGAEVQADTSKSLKTGSLYNVTAPKITDWVAVSHKIDGAQKTGLTAQIPNIQADHEVVFVYKEDKNNNGIPDDEEDQDYTVTEKYQDPDGTEVQADTTKTLKAGERYNVTAPKITDWVAVSHKIDGAQKTGLTAQIANIQADHEVIFVYKEDKNNNGIPDDEEDKDFTITEKYQDPDGTEVQADTTKPLKAGELYNVTAPKITDWVAVSHKIDGDEKTGVTAQIANVQADHEVTFVYKEDKNNNGIPDDEEGKEYKITEKYTNPAGTPIPNVPDTQKLVPENGVYNKIAPQITDWVAVGYKIGNGAQTDGTVVTIDPVTKDETVSFIYKEDKNHNGIPDDEEGQDFTITEKYQKPDGTEIQPNTTKGVKTGGYYNVEAPKITDWVAVAHKIDGTQKEGIIAQIGNIKANHEVVFVYKEDKNHNGIPDDEEGTDHTITEKYQDPDGTEIQPDSTKGINAGGYYNTEAPQIPDWVAVSHKIDGEEKDGIFAQIGNVREDHEVTFVYKEDKNNNGIPDDEEGQDFTITEKYQDPNGTEVQPETSKGMKAGGYYNQMAPKIEDWVAVSHKIDDTEISGITAQIGNISADHEVTFIYKEDKNNNGIPDDEEGDGFTVTEKYQTPDGDEVQEDTTKTLQAGEIYNVTAPKITDWVAVAHKIDGEEKAGTTAQIGSIQEDHEVIFVYKEDKNNNGIPDDEEGEFFKVTEKYTSPNGTPLPNVPDTEKMVPANGVYNKIAPQITDWVPVAYKIGDGPQTEGTVVTIDPVTKDETVSFIYKEDKNHNGIPDDEEGQDFTITEKYQKPDGTEIQPNTTKGVKTGGYYNVEAPKITDWVAVSHKIDGTQKEGIIAQIGNIKANHEVVFVYKEDKNHNGIPDDEEGTDFTITEKYQNPDGTEIQPDSTKGINAGGYYNTEAPQIPDWVAVAHKIDGEEKDGIVAQIGNIREDHEVTFVYKEDKNNNGIPDDEEGSDFTITEKYQDPDGTEIQADTTKGMKAGGYYNQMAPSITDWVAVSHKIDGTEKSGVTAQIGNISADHEVTFIYKEDKNNNGIPDDEEGDGFTVTEKYQTPDGDEVQEDTTKTLQAGELYNVTAPKITDWVAVAHKIDGEEKSGVTAQIGNIQADHEVTFVYKEDKNNNGIPDDEEGQDFTITEKYQKPDGTEVQEDTTKTLDAGSYYNVTAPKITDWVAVGHKIDGEEKTGITARIGDVQADHEVTFIYKEDKNNNGIPDEDEDKPSKPSINPITPGDKEITGEGTPGNTIDVTLPDGTKLPDIPIDNDGKWTVDVPDDVDLKPGDKVIAEEKNPFGDVSEPAEAVVGDYPKAPIINPVKDTDTKITGTGEAGKDIIVTFPDGNEATGKIGNDGKWSLDVPSGTTLHPGDEIKAVVEDKNGNKSPEATTIVTGGSSGKKFKITEKYQKPNGGTIKADTSVMIDQNGRYEKEAPKITDWVAVGHKIGSGDLIEDTTAVIDPVTKNEIVKFVYKEDKNNNGIPDDEERQFKITEKYQKPNGGTIKADTSVMVDQNGRYEKEAPKITDWVAVGHKIGSGDLIEDTTAVIDPVTKNEIVKFVYKEDKNNNGIPDDEEKADIKITEKYQTPKGEAIKSNTETVVPNNGRYEKTAPYIKNWVAVGHKIGTGTLVSDNTAVIDPATKNETVTFVYKKDKNNDGIPDDEESQCLKITEKYQKQNGQMIVSDTETMVRKNGSYEKLAPYIKNWVAVTYKIGNSPQVSGNAAIIDPVTKDETVIFIYKADKNNDGIPDDEVNKCVKITEKYESSNGTKIMQNTQTLVNKNGKYEKQAPKITDWVSVGYKIGSGPMVSGKVAVINPAKKNETVTFIYKEDKNNNGIPDDQDCKKYKIVAKDVTIYKGDIFNPLGYIRVKDGSGADVTNRVTIKVTGKVDTRTPGTYNVTYKVTDKYGNTQTKTIKVTVLQKKSGGGCCSK